MKSIKFTVLALALMITLISVDRAFAQCSLEYVFTGEAAGDQFGHSVSGVGDVDNDGFADLIVGAIFNDAGGSKAGRAYVFSGATGDVLHVFTGEAAGDQFGVSVSGAGDVNDDGFIDIIVGSPHAEGTVVGVRPGLAYVYSGADGTLMFTFIGEATGDIFGISVSDVGDMNNDGYADLIVGASANDAGGNAAGRAYVFYGGAGPFPVTVAASNASRIFTGHTVNETFGYSVSGIGDVNNDGYDDVFVGAYANGLGTGMAYVYSGADGALLYKFIGETPNDMFGFSVSGAGDLNGNGLPDLVVGAWRDNSAGTWAGRAYAFYDKPGPFPITIIASNADLIFTGETAGDQFGNPVSGAGDVNGDGYDDIIVGADGNDAAGSWAGRAYLYSGVDGTLLSFVTGEAENDQFGISVSGAGDVNHDGFADVIVGARQEGKAEAGKAYVFSCAPSDPISDTVINESNGHCYELVSIRPNFTWQQSRDSAIALGGYLATATNQAEMDFILDSIVGNSVKPIWLGGWEPTEGTWQWVTGEPFVYSNWCPGEPNEAFAGEDFISFNTGGLQCWNDSRNWFVVDGFFIVEWECDNTVNVALDIDPQECPNFIEIDDDVDDDDRWTRNSLLDAVGKKIPEAEEHEDFEEALKVAILGAPDFDVTTINAASVRILGNPPIRWKLRDKTAPADRSVDSCACVNVGPDGHVDLILRFSERAFIDSLGAVTDGEQIILTLTGELLDGTPFEGSDCVIISADDSDDDGRGPAEVKPNEFVLGAAYPNPFNPATKFNLVLPEASEWNVTIYNINGQKVDEYSGFSEAGVVTVEWDAAKYASGVYFYKAIAGEFSATRKMTLLK